MSVAIRIFLTVILLIFVWMDHKWALYTVVTLLTVANELQIAWLKKLSL
jgi:hypothetical protein